MRLCFESLINPLQDFSFFVSSNMQSIHPGLCVIVQKYYPKKVFPWRKYSHLCEYISYLSLKEEVAQNRQTCKILKKKIALSDTILMRRALQFKRLVTGRPTHRKKVQEVDPSQLELFTFEPIVTLGKHEFPLKKILYFDNNMKVYI